MSMQPGATRGLASEANLVRVGLNVRVRVRVRLRLRA